MDISCYCKTLHGFLTIVFCIFKQNTTVMMCYEVWLVATAWQSCVHSALAHCRVNTASYANNTNWSSFSSLLQII